MTVIHTQDLRYLTQHAELTLHCSHSHILNTSAVDSLAFVYTSLETDEIGVV